MAASLHIYMMGPGFVSQKKAAYEETNDLRYVWTGGDITPLYKPSELEGIPGTPEEAWGEAFMKNVRSVANRPLMPWPHWFIPLQSEAGPAETPMEDARDRWFLDSSEPDIMADFLNRKDGGAYRSIPVCAFYTSDFEYLYHFTEYAAIYDKERVVVQNIRAPKPGEAPQDTRARADREFGALQQSPFWRIWTSSMVDEIVSALHRKAVLGSV